MHCLASLEGKKALTNTLCLKHVSRFIVLYILLYGCQIWPTLQGHTQRPNWFQLDCLRFYLVCHNTNVSVRRSCYLPSIESLISGFKQLRWLEPVVRLPDYRLLVNGPVGQLGHQVSKDVPHMLMAAARAQRMLLR